MQQDPDNFPKVVENPPYVPTESQGVCKQRSDQGPFDYQTIFGVFIIIFAIVLIAVSAYCLCKQWSANNAGYERLPNGGSTRRGGSSSLGAGDDGEHERGRGSSRADRNDDAHSHHSGRSSQRSQDRVRRRQSRRHGSSEKTHKMHGSTERKRASHQ